MSRTRSPTFSPRARNDKKPRPKNFAPGATKGGAPDDGGVDASFAASWFLPDERSEATDAVLFALKNSEGFVPSLFWHEARNLFVTAERRGRLEPGGAALSMAQLRRLPLADEGAGSDDVVLTLAARHLLTAYDASYLSLALTRRVPLASSDRKLVGAARAEGVDILGPLADVG